MKRGRTQGKRVEWGGKSRDKFVRELRERRFHTCIELYIVQNQFICQFFPGLYIAGKVEDVGL